MTNQTWDECSDGRACTRECPLTGACLRPTEPTPASLLSLSFAAAYVVALDADPNLTSSARGALGVFALLIGLPDADALAYAHTIADGNVTAVIPPF